MYRCIFALYPEPPQIADVSMVSGTLNFVQIRVLLHPFQVRK